ncbi:DUF4336 domain-containing protein [Enterovibrio makurazakiensis]|uniref:DUF4336 domain-containing protein n=1 Tax=Enterovibrio makurazakiensis TaxID=2910232 RepID=UPI003D240543
MIEWKANHLWYYDDSFRCFGVDIGQRMTVIRLADGGLLVHNPCELTESLKSQIDALGIVRCVTTANHTIHQSLSDWWLTYSDAYFYSAPDLAAKRSDIGFDGELTSKSSPLWRNQLYQTVLRGNNQREDVVFCDPESQTLVIGESIMLLSGGSVLRQLVGKSSGCHTHVRVPFYEKYRVTDIKLLRRSLQEILTWPFDHILPIHGDPIQGDGKKKLAAAYSWVLNH